VESSRPDAAELAAAATAAVASAMAALGLEDCTMTLVVGDDALLTELNRRYRGRDEPTDVLSFPAPAGATEPGAPRYLGDVVISLETVAARRAPGAPPSVVAAEVELLAVHGLLHLLGHDDATADGRAQMEALEERLGVR
jgi:probable rRNA maturation factor